MSVWKNRANLFNTRGMTYNNTKWLYLLNSLPIDEETPVSSVYELKSVLSATNSYNL